MSGERSNYFYDTMFDATHEVPARGFFGVQQNSTNPSTLFCSVYGRVSQTFEDFVGT
jgi:hypothetical protein